MSLSQHESVCNDLLQEPENLADYLFIETFCAAPQRLKAKLYDHATPRAIGDSLVHLARVEYGRHHCELRTSGRWSVVTPIETNSDLQSNFAAFAVDDDKLRQTFSGSDFAVNLESAMADARLHPKGRLRTHWRVWDWMRDDFAGALVLDWDRMAAFLKTWRVSSLECASQEQARAVHAHLAASLRVPDIHICNGPM
jgi:hypothetical protein